MFKICLKKGEKHDSLKISNGKWMWFSQGFGGVSALDYLMKVKGCTFNQAMEILEGRDESPSIFVPRSRRKKLLLPISPRTSLR